ncbi:hypothetical protein [Hansschlegelia zhihuaiae]|uniref:hypothetical protein n=1 Tax=Hansschlegelia zhihuaiae TaxID=405005 RepID=UPI0013E8E109|nr:hypothetical protein [Hansschlegelia zhihuaiae]
MMRKLLLALGTALLFAPLVDATTAHAQATRTWVSGVGDDVNPCSRTAPCKTFAGAISKTAAGGEINVIDQGAYGAVTITKSITISAKGVTAGVLASATNGVIVNVGANDKVILDGLDINGAPPTVPGLNGVRMIGQGRLTIRNCMIQNFSVSGVDLQGTGNARVFIMDSFITNTTIGFNIKGNGVANIGNLDNVVLDLHATAAVKIDGPSTLVMSRSVLNGSGAGIQNLNGGAVISYGNNLIRNGGAPTQTLSLQ